MMKTKNFFLIMLIFSILAADVLAGDTLVTNPIEKNQGPKFHLNRDDFCQDYLGNADPFEGRVATAVGKTTNPEIAGVDVVEEVSGDHYFEEEIALCCIYKNKEWVYYTDDVLSYYEKLFKNRGINYCGEYACTEQLYKNEVIFPITVTEEDGEFDNCYVCNREVLTSTPTVNTYAYKWEYFTSVNPDLEFDALSSAGQILTSKFPTCRDLFFACENNPNDPDIVTLLSAHDTCQKLDKECNLREIKKEYFNSCEAVHLACDGEEDVNKFNRFPGFIHRFNIEYELLGYSILGYKIQEISANQYYCDICKDLRPDKGFRFIRYIVNGKFLGLNQDTPCSSLVNSEDKTIECIIYAGGFTEDNIHDCLGCPTAGSGILEKLKIVTRCKEKTKLILYDKDDNFLAEVIIPDDKTPKINFKKRFHEEAYRDVSDGDYIVLERFYTSAGEKTTGEFQYIDVDDGFGAESHYIIVEGDFSNGFEWDDPEHKNYNCGERIKDVFFQGKENDDFSTKNTDPPSPNYDEGCSIVHIWDTESGKGDFKTARMNVRFKEEGKSYALKYSLKFTLKEGSIDTEFRNEEESTDTLKVYFLDKNDKLIDPKYDIDPERTIDIVQIANDASHTIEEGDYILVKGAYDSDINTYSNILQQLDLSFSDENFKDSYLHVEADFSKAAQIPPIIGDPSDYPCSKRILVQYKHNFLDHNFFTNGEQYAGSDCKMNFDWDPNGGAGKFGNDKWFNLIFKEEGDQNSFNVPFNIEFIIKKGSVR
ncbi:MAG: hypothetical protein KKF44_00835 [Nanoarchaeota archaeon]|nr:hypothetical protein [Nanoarchaeota archaeon]